MAEVILEVKNVVKTFDDFMALKGVSIKLRKGEFSALIGPNGAGKTTLYNVISGKFPPTSGEVVFDGRLVHGLPPHQLLRLGISRSFQLTNVFAGLTVRENFLAALVACHDRGKDLWNPLKRCKDLYEEAEHILEQLGLTHVTELPVKALSYGDKRLVEVGLALASRPKLVMLDEPTAGMNPEETDRMIHLLKKLSREMDTTFFLTEHDMKVVFSVADRIFVLHQGELLAEGSPAEIRENRKVKEAYLGERSVAGA